MSTDQEAAPAAAAHPRKVLVMPEAFAAGDNEDWHSWIKYFKNCATLNAWNDNQRRDFLAVRLRGVAQQTYQDLTEAVQEGTFAELCEALGRRFAPAERVEVYKAEFHARRRVSGEKLGELAAQVRRLAKKAFPGASSEIVDHLAKDRFIDALEDKDLRIRIREGNPVSLDDAVSRGIQLEAIHEAENAQTRVRSHVRTVGRPEMENPTFPDPMTALLERNTAALETVVSLVQSLGSQSASQGIRDGQRRGQRSSRNRYGNMECWNCGRRGHFRVDCPNRPEQPEN